MEDHGQEGQAAGPQGAWLVLGMTKKKS